MRGDRDASGSAGLEAFNRMTTMTSGGTRSRVLAFLLLTGSLAACGRGGSAPAPPPAPEPLARLEAAQRLYYDDGGGIADSLRVAVRDPALLRDLWDRATSTLDSPPPLPTVDFAREMVLVVAAGRMNPGDRIQVDSAGVRSELDPDGRRREIMLAQVRIIVDCTGFDADVYPVEIVRVRRFDGPVQFLHARERAPNCQEDR
jgi:hypothetical protein